ncbi:hypothetical protein RhiirA4_508191 [Rhizophagus irregularis]|uniref:MD-2-related lipid-recognition domain-containing protein n=1 Tax=Rhizophagus irregularis TaxID=588596 RepID=A0A2I1G8Q8_9GLOM|nr:hypothetical protein RhiirA4_508191 [Rhizophagus irregularis]
MNRNFIFVFILLATFSMVNAIPHQLRKGKIKFHSCMSKTDIIDVTVKPDSIVSEYPANYTASGKLSHAIIADKTTFGVTYFVADGSVPLGDPYKQYFDKSYKAGKNFTISAEDVPTPLLSKVYQIYVNIWDEEIGTIACVFTKVNR